VKTRVRGKYSRVHAY